MKILLSGLCPTRVELIDKKLTGVALRCENHRGDLWHAIQTLRIEDRNDCLAHSVVAPHRRAAQMSHCDLCPLSSPVAQGLVVRGGLVDALPDIPVGLVEAV